MTESSSNTVVNTLFTPTDLSSVEPVLKAFINEIAPFRCWHHGKFADFASGRVIQALPIDQWRLLLMAVIQQIIPLEDRIRQYREQTLDHTFWGGSSEGEALWQTRMNLVVAARELLSRKLPLQAQELQVLLNWCVRDEKLFSHVWLPTKDIVKATLHFSETQPLSAGHMAELKTFKIRLKLQIKAKNNKKLLADVEALLNQTAPICIESGEAWSDRAINDLLKIDKTEQPSWFDFIHHCKTATTTSPTAKWQKATANWVQSLTLAQIKKVALPWLDLVDLPRTDKITEAPFYQGDPNLKIIDVHVDILRGLAWTLSEEQDEQVIEALGKLAISAYKRVPGLGPRAVKLGNACVYSLGIMGGQQAISQLETLKSQLDFKAALTAIEKSLEKANATGQ